MEIVEKLENILNENEALPFLFVGSGISRRYLSLPDWEGLLAEIASLIDENPLYFQRLKQKVREKVNPAENYNLFMTELCDRISSDLNDVWYNYEDGQFEDSRLEAGETIRDDNFNPLKFEISKFILSKKTLNNEYDDEIDLFKSLTDKSIAGVITTNYDCLMEDFFNFEKYSSQDELLFNQNFSVGEIYKIHGCATQPKTIMINADDYRKIDEKNRYIAAKLLTIFIEHPVIFMGYSLQDEDVQNVLEEIGNCLNQEQLQTLSTRLLFVKWNPDLDSTEVNLHTIKLNSGRVIQATEIAANSFIDTLHTLSQNKSKIPASAVRKLKKFMYTLAISETANEKILVQDIDNFIASDDYNVVVGFGPLPSTSEISKRGYTPIEAKEIYLDIILDDRDWDYRELVKRSLPKIAKSTNSSIPVFKYVRGLEPDEIPSEIKEIISKISGVESFIPNSQKKRFIKEESIRELVERHPENINRQLREIPFLREKLKKDELSQYLNNLIRDNKELYTGSNSNVRSTINKLIRILDYLKFHDDN